MPRQIIVRPGATGWWVESDALQSRLEFASGARAEDAGRRLARDHAASGRGAEVRIYLRDGSVGGVVRFEGARALAGSD
jgi:hypothetical protein